MILIPSKSDLMLLHHPDVTLEPMIGWERSILVVQINELILYPIYLHNYEIYYKTNDFNGIFLQEFIDGVKKVKLSSPETVGTNCHQGLLRLQTMETQSDAHQIKVNILEPETCDLDTSSINIAKNHTDRCSLAGSGEKGQQNGATETSAAARPNIIIPETVPFLNSFYDDGDKDSQATEPDGDETFDTKSGW